MSVKLDSVGYLLEFAQAAPDRHQKEEAQINHGSDLAYDIKRGVRRLGAYDAQYQEIDDEDRVKELVPGGSVADRLDRGVVEPRQEEQDDHRAAHGDRKSTRLNSSH